MMPFAKNETAKEVAKHFGVSERTVTTTWRRNGHPRSPEQTTGAIWPGPCEPREIMG
jgi:transposase